ncbi:hypothetical protein NIES3974_37940 [Calothrix sp. NIES-3974]|nr:hypothetical protein NIES3974_37940 [Calothrix sp. NIES-3974]
MIFKQFTHLKNLYNPIFLLLVLSAALISIQLHLAWKYENQSLFGTSSLFWGVLSFRLWERRQQLHFHSDFVSTICGVIIILFTLMKVDSMHGFGGVYFIYLLPVVFGFAIALLASGAKFLKHYQWELLTLFFIAVPEILPPSLVDISPLTAKFSALLLWYLGFDVVRSGVNLFLPGGSIEVYSGCSGLELIFQLLGLAVVFLLMFPHPRSQKLILPMVAIIIGFVVNGFRVALMLFLVANQDKNAFEYWHIGTGSLAFSLLAVIIFACWCWRIVGQQKNLN